MHHPRSYSAARRLRLASLLFLANRLMVPVTGGFILISLLANDRNLMMYGLLGVLISALLMITQWIVASHAGCPLCRTPVLAPMRCMKHRRARSLLGSYQFRVAIAIMFKDRFRCQYCNETTAMDVRETLRGSCSRGYKMNKSFSHSASWRT